MTILGQRPAPVSTYDAVADRSAALVIRGYSTSFGTASRLLAEPVRSHVRNIYALVRIADEVVDTPDPVSGGLTVEDRADLLDRLEEETARALRRGHSSNLVVHAFAGTARRCGIGVDLLTPFFDSMRTDLHVTEHDADSLQRYVYGSAEVVGLMCLRAFLTDVRATADYDELAPGARRLGAAFQKVNFLRDLAEDSAVLGRTYFPGVRPENLTDCRRDALLDEIDADLSAAAAAVPLLPPSSRRAVAVAHALFSELASRLRATPAREIAVRRVSVPTPVKARLVLRSLVPERSR
jgi:phytoene/squalene synthetase